MRSERDKNAARAQIVRAMGIGMVGGGQSQNSYGSWTAGDPVALARPPEDFEHGTFGPATPVRPSPVDTAPQGLNRAQPRRWQYPPTWNMPKPPGTEGTRLTSFATLRALADMSSFLRMCIDKRIEEILGLEWDIVPTIDAASSILDDVDRADFQYRRAQAIAFFQRPDPEFDTFHSWLRAALEDVFVIDALSIYIAPPRVPGHGLFGTDLAALALIAGETIRPMLDLQGGRPQPPAVAFQQYIFGVPRVDMVDIITDEEMDNELGVPQSALRGDQMLYLPYHRRTISPYGLSHVESVLLPATIEMSKQMYAKTYYTEGNVPASWVIIGNADTPQQVRQWQDSLDATIGDIGARHQVTVLPANSKAEETKPNAFSDNYDMANKEEILGVFGLTAMEMGMMPGRSGSSGGMAGSAHMAQIGANASNRTATKPLLMFLKRNLFDLVLQKFAGQKDMQWKWLGLEAEVDPDKKLAAETLLVAGGLRTRDEIRLEHGWKPWGLPLTAMPTVQTPDGVVSLAAPATDTTNPDVNNPEIRDIDTAGGVTENEDPDSNSENTNPDVGEGATGGVTHPDPTGGSGGRTDNTPNPNTSSPLHDSMPAPGSVAPPSDQPTTKSAMTELDQLRGYIRHGRDIKKFETTYLSNSALQIVAENLPVRGLASTIKMVQSEIEREGDPIYAEVAEATAVLLRRARYGNISEWGMLDGIAHLMKAVVDDPQIDLLVGELTPKSNSGECLDVLEKFDDLRRRSLQE